MADDYTLTVEQARRKAQAIGPGQRGAFDDLATDALVAIANGCEPAQEIAQAIIAEHPRIFSYESDLVGGTS